MKKQLFFISAGVLLQITNCLLPTISCAQKIAGGTFHSLAVCDDSTIMAWGINVDGELGNGTNTVSSNIPMQVSFLTGIIAIAAGGNYSLALKNDGTVWAWGSNQWGQLGNGTNTDNNIPVQVSGLTDITAIAVGAQHSLALKNDGTVWAWGNNQWGQLGNGTNTDSNIPAQVSNLTGITAIARGFDHSLALKNDGTVWGWGWNTEGELGNGTNDDSNIPVQVSGLTSVTAISGGFHSLALENDSTVWAWGWNAEGELGNGTNTDSNVPMQVSSLTGIASIAGGVLHSFARKNDGTVWAWGYNSYGEFGNGTNTDSNIPVQVNYLTGIPAIAGGNIHSLAVKNDGTVWAWGWNYYGQLGTGDTSDSNLPVQVTGLCPVATSCNAAFTLLADTLIPHHYWALNQAIGNPPLTYYWSWGDGTYDSIAYPSHIYADSGFYTICLTIQDSTGCSDSICIDYTLQKLSSQNLIITINVVDSIPSIPTNIQSSNVLQSWSVFPNPAAGNSFINYTLSTPATVTIDLFDVLGNKLQQLVNANQQQGEHNTTLDAHNLVNGVYVLQIRAGEQVAEQKVVVMN